jgi:hypothetical protein
VRWTTRAEIVAAGVSDDLKCGDAVDRGMAVERDLPARARHQSLEVSIEPRARREDCSGRLHAIANELHEQTTKMKEGRYLWALSPDETTIRCLDSAKGSIAECE